MGIGRDQMQDIRYALRNFAANRSFAATAVLSLILGIGVNTSIFSIINAVMLRSLPVEDPKKLVAITIGNDDVNDAFTNPIWEQIRDNPQSFSGALAYADDRFDLAEGGETHFAEGMWVNGDFFRVLGVPAVQGRVFAPRDDQHGGGSSGPVAVISYQFWKKNFAGRSDAIGQTVSLNRHKFEIVGVTPPLVHRTGCGSRFRCSYSDRMRANPARGPEPVRR
jgi:putative ABC transport system permease protein